MRHIHFRFTALLLTLTIAFSTQAQDVEPCMAFPGAFDEYLALVVTFLGNDGDIDDDGLPEQAALALIEAVACVDTTSDMNDATFNAYNMNLAVFDLEIGISHLHPYRRAIAMLMLTSADVQAQLNSILSFPFLGTYEIVQCSGTDCTPDPVPDVEASVAVRTLDIITRDTAEPYSGTGDLDMDGTNNATEFANVIAKNGRTHDFVVAATSPGLNGTEVIRNPGGSSGGGCFVATAAYGTPLANEISTLRTWRDGTLLESTLGTAFVDTYYRISPALAETIATRPVLRQVSRTTLYPVVWLIQTPALGLAALLLTLISMTKFVQIASKRRTKRSL